MIVNAYDFPKFVQLMSQVDETNESDSFGFLIPVVWQPRLTFNELVQTEVPMAVTKSLGGGGTGGGLTGDAWRFGAHPAGWGIPVRYLCVILLPLMTNILDYVAAVPYVHPEPLAMAVYITGLGGRLSLQREQMEYTNSRCGTPPLGLGALWTLPSLERLIRLT